MRWIVLVGVLLPAVAMAHRVVVFPYWEGEEVRVEAFFSDGTPVKGGVVRVYDPAGQLLTEGRTDAEGTFGFKPEGKGPLKVVLEASMGHKAEAVLEPEGASEPVQKAKAPPEEVPPRVDLKALKEVVKEAVAEEVRPIIRELARREAGPSFRDVVGGVGWIVGLMGIWLYLKSRRPRGG